MNNNQAYRKEYKFTMNISIIYILISVVGSAAGQLFLKKGMNSMGPVTLSLNQLPNVIWQMATNLDVIIGLVIYLIGTVFWLVALSRVDLSFAYPFASIQYMIMLAAGWFMFDEKITINRLIGTAIIGIGVLFISKN